MAFDNRHLNPWFYNDTINQLCEPYCDLSRNLEKRHCPLPCYKICNKICQTSTYKTSSPSTYEISPPPLLNQPPRVSLSLIICFSLLLTTFFLFSFYIFHRAYTIWYKSRRRPQHLSQTHVDFHDHERGPTLGQIRTVGLLPSVINGIAIYEYKNGEGIVEGTECSVCLSEFQENETLRLLPKCNHAFHLPCIDTWLSSHTNCPNCRAGIVESPAGSPEPAPAPAPELSLDNLGPIEETHLRISENNGEFEGGTEEEENGSKRNEFPFQPMRRSFSFDSSSANIVLANNSHTQIGILNESNTGIDIDHNSNDVNRRLIKLMSSSSIGRSLQKGPILMKRSFSWSGKVLLSKHRRSRIRSSILPS